MARKRRFAPEFMTNVALYDYAEKVLERINDPYDELRSDSQQLLLLSSHALHCVRELRVRGVQLSMCQGSESR